MCRCIRVIACRQPKIHCETDETDCGGKGGRGPGSHGVARRRFLPRAAVQPELRPERAQCPLQRRLLRRHEGVGGLVRHLVRRVLLHARRHAPAAAQDLHQHCGTLEGMVDPLPRRRWARCRVTHQDYASARIELVGPEAAASVAPLALFERHALLRRDVLQQVRHAALEKPRRHPGLPAQATAVSEGKKRGMC